MPNHLSAAVAAAAAFVIAVTPVLAQMAEPPSTETITIGELAISQPWARATPEGAVTGAGYLAITNTGAVDDRLIGVETDRAAIAEIHEMSMANDRMTMRPLEDGLVIPAGETVILQPGGYHIMMIELTGSIVEETPVVVTLIFEIAGAVTVDLSVYPIGSAGPDQELMMDPDAMMMDGMDMDAMDGMDMDAMDGGGESQ